MDTTANLATDYRENICDKLTVQNPEIEVIKGTEGLHETKTVHYYRIPPTRYFLDIKDGTVVADDWAHSEADKTKKITKLLRYEMNNSDQTIQFTAALYSGGTSKYIVIGKNNQIQLDDNPMWYIASTTRGYIMFKKNDLYLAYNAETGQIVADHSEFQFEELPADHVAEESSD